MKLTIHLLHLIVKLTLYLENRAGEKTMSCVWEIGWWIYFCFLLIFHIFLVNIYYFYEENTLKEIIVKKFKRTKRVLQDI